MTHRGPRRSVLPLVLLATVVLAAIPPTTATAGRWSFRPSAHTWSSSAIRSAIRFQRLRDLLKNCSTSILLSFQDQVRADTPGSRTPLKIIFNARLVDGAASSSRHSDAHTNIEQRSLAEPHVPTGINLVRLFAQRNTSWKGPGAGVIL